MKYVVILFLLMVRPLAAQEIAAGVDPVTASGTISIVDDESGWARHLHVGDAIFFTDNQYRFVNVVDQRGALYLLGLSDGGNACGGSFAWLHTENGRPRLSAEFGTCAPLIDVWSDRETVSVSMWSGVMPSQLVGFIYDGREMRQVDLDTPDGDVAPNDDLTALAGRHPAEVFRAAQSRPVLKSLLDDEFEAVSLLFDLSTGFARDGDWMIANASPSPRRGEGRAAIALHLFDSRVAVAWRLDNSECRMRGIQDDLLRDILFAELTCDA